MIECFKDKCSGCRACEKICPKQAIEMKRDAKGFLYPVVNYDKCVKCQLCKNRCPIANDEEKVIEKKVYSAYCKDKIIVEKSSSGGIFTVLSQYILQNDGVVFGAAFTDDFNVEHIYIETIEELYKLQTSKYVQSDLKNTYKEAKEFLEKGKLVYFSGTPCQIEGLKAYLSKDYENLFTQDIICHGVPSPKVWQEYLKYKNKKIQEVNFRSKEKSDWQNFNLKILYENDDEYNHHDKDIFMQLFLKNEILRESCYQCKFKKENRISDITLADFWGASHIENNIKNERGISLVIVNSSKAQNLIEKIKDKIIMKEVDFAQAVQYNQSMIKSVEKGEKFKEVTELIEQGNFKELFKLEI